MKMDMPAKESAVAVTPERIMQVGMAYWGSKALLSAVGMGLFTRLSERTMTLEELTKALSLNPRGARDFFDSLVAMGFLTREGGRYGNSAEAAAFLVRGTPSYMGGILEMSDSRLYGDWDELSDCLRSGKPRAGLGGEADPFKELYSTPDKLAEFLRAMTGHSMTAGAAIAEKFPWKDYKTFVDVGCAEGGSPTMIAKAHPHLKGTGADLPQVRPLFEDYVKRHGLADRLSFKALDFFNEPLPKADVIVMGHILHDWDLAQKRMLVKKAYEALPKGGSFVVYEALIDDDRSRNAFGLLMSLNMLVETPGGFDYTGADCRGWMKEAGFTETRVVHLLGPDSMVIGVK